MKEKLKEILVAGAISGVLIFVIDLILQRN